MFRFLLSSDVRDPLPLDIEPVGWDDMRYTLERHPKYHGVSFSISTALTFRGPAAAYIQSIYEALGVEAGIRLTVFERDPNNLREEEVYSGLLDLTEYSISEDGVRVPLSETGFAQKFLNLDDVEVNLLRDTSQGGTALAPLVPLEVQMHSQPILKRTEFVTERYQPQYQSIEINTAALRVSVLVFGFGEPTINELELFTYSTGTFEDDKPPEIFTAKGSGPYTFELNLDTNVQIIENAGKFARVDIEYYLQIGDGPPRPLIRDVDPANTGDYDSAARLKVAATITADVRLGEKVYLWGRIIVDEVTENLLGKYSFQYRARVNQGSFLRVTAITSTPATLAKGVLAHEALQRCVESITDQPASFYSEYFGRIDCAVPYAVDGPGSLALVTSSWLLRNFPIVDTEVFGAKQQGRPLLVSFRELYDSLDAIHCLGVGIEFRNGRQVVRIEPRSFFYQQTDGLQIAEANSQQKAVAQERIFNTVNIGYQRWKSGNENGLREFNGKRTYILPISKLRNTYSPLSPYVTAGNVIEETRRDQYVASPDKENSGDGQNFLVCLRRVIGGGFETERNQAFTVVEGVLTPSLTYNLRLSPGRMLRAHGAWLRAGLLHQADKALTRGAVEGNDQLVTQLTSETAPLDEGKDVPVSDLAPAYFHPEHYQLTSTLTRSALKRLRANPYERIPFPGRDGSLLKGYLIKSDVQPATRVCTLTLLRAV